MGKNGYGVEDITLLNRERLGNVKFNMISTYMVKYMIRGAFLFFCVFFSVNRKKVTFASYRSDKLEGNLKCLKETWAVSDSTYQFKYLFRKLDTSLIGKLKYFLHMIKATYHLATSRFFIIDDYYFPVYMLDKLREGTEVIQVWHAAGAFKKFGHSIVNKEYGPSEEYAKIVKVHGNYSRVFVSSSSVIPFYAEAFAMNEEQIYPLGLPRTDFFFNNNDKSEELRTLFDANHPIFSGKKLILYAPTFRGSGHYQDNFQSPLNVHLLHQTLGDEYALLIHLHPYIKSGISIAEEDEDFAVHVNGEHTIEELLLLADILITDYSSVIFDYSLMEKPMYFFAPDLKEYVNERNFYYPFEEMIPGPLYMNSEQLGRGIKQGDCQIEKVKKFKRHFFDDYNGKASLRVVTHLLSKEGKK